MNKALIHPSIDTCGRDPFSDGMTGFNPKSKQPSCFPNRNFIVDIEYFTECLPVNCHHCVI